LPKNKSRTTTDSEVQTREFHERYLRAVNNPHRRKILDALKEGFATIDELKNKTGFDETGLKWHLAMLEHGFCVEKDTVQGKLIYRITQEGRVIEHI